MLVLALPAVMWVNLVAWVIGTTPAPVVRTTLRTALPMAVLAGISVEVSQLLIDVVEPWHDLAGHCRATCSTVNQPLLVPMGVTPAGQSQRGEDTNRR